MSLCNLFYLTFNLTDKTHLAAAPRAASCWLNSLCVHTLVLDFKHVFTDQQTQCLVTHLSLLTIPVLSWDRCRWPCMHIWHWHWEFYVFFPRALSDSKLNLAWALSWHATKWRAPSIGVLEMHIPLGSHTITHDLDLWQEIREAKPFFLLQLLDIVGIFTQKLQVNFTNNYKVTSR